MENVGQMAKNHHVRGTLFMKLQDYQWFQDVMLRLQTTIPRAVKCGESPGEVVSSTPSNLVGVAKPNSVSKSPVLTGCATDSHDGALTS